MEVALTFGSLGDIIHLCQLAIQLGQAVGVGCGAVGESAKEYQELREDLNLFVHILTQVVTTYEKHEPSPYLEGLDQTSKSVVDRTASLIQDALDHFQSRYKNSLHLGGSGKKLKDVYKKLEWSTREKERIQCLREKLQESTQRLQLLTSLASRKSARADSATLLARVAEVQDLVSKSCSSQREILDLMRQQRGASEEQVQKLNEVNQQLVKQDRSSHSILCVAGDALNAIVEVKDLLVQVSQDVINVQVVFDSMCFRSLDPTKELPAIIEDALGRQITFQPDWIDTLNWEALDALLSCRFRGQNGHDMVMRRAYALEESASGSDLDPVRPLHLSLRRGMKINMAMIFETATRLLGACPRCLTEIDAPKDVTVQCPRYDCGMWLRMQSVEGYWRQTLSPEDETVYTKRYPGATAMASTLTKPADFQRVRLFPYEDTRRKTFQGSSMILDTGGSIHYCTGGFQINGHDTSLLAARTSAANEDSSSEYPRWQARAELAARHRLAKEVDNVLEGHTAQDKADIMKSLSERPNNIVKWL
ncbi:hypothetical protein CEP53_007124 [Fusarium sp. AF-6]|nr:hypothetical protein CEP53_007124 [Fusarium sp. AF-6]